MKRQHLILRWYFSYYHFIAANRLKKNDLDPRKIHAHTVTTLATGLLMWAYAITAHLTISSPIPGIVGYVFSLIHLASPLLFRFSSNIFFTSSVLIGSGMIHQGTFSFFTGGYDSDILIWWSILPFLSGLIVGGRGAILWFVMAIALSSTLLIMDISGFQFPDLISPKGRLVAHSLIVFGYIFLNTLLIYVYFIMRESTEQLLKSQSKKIDDLFRVLFHDLANPLGRISIGLNLAKSQNAKGLEIIEKATNSMLDITQNVRKMYAVSSGKEGLQLNLVSLTPLLLQLKETFASELASKNLSIVYEINQDHDYTVLVEPVSFKNQVLNNILSNAIKFSPDKGEIQVRVAPFKESYLKLEIIDKGIGIPKNILDNLFVLNQRTSREGTRGEKGTGFGMPIMKSFIEMYDGQVFVESRECPEGVNSGTTFKLILRGGISPKEDSFGEIQ